MKSRLRQDNVSRRTPDADIRHSIYSYLRNAVLGGTAMAMTAGELQKARKVLDYWYTIEFLAQDKYDDMREVRTKLQKAQHDFAKGRFRGKTIWSYRELDNAHSIYDMVSADAVSCGMKKWGNITVYIGKIKREACIECIAKALPDTLPGVPDTLPGVPEERPEKTYDSIAWASLQIAPDGTYVDHSLSLSTIIWSMNQLSKGRLSESIDERQYRSAAEDIEKEYFRKEEGLKQETEEPVQGTEEPIQETEEPIQETEEPTQESAEPIQEFAPNAVTAETLKDLYKRIEKDFILGNIEWTEDEQEYQEVYGLYFQLFADEISRNRLDEDNYLGLSHDYFSEDIRFILQRIEDDSISSQGYMTDDLIRYISAWGESGQKGKIDLVSPKDKRTFFQQVSEILEVEHAPLGKWPSKFMPAFMQQMAVNLCIRKGTSELYGVNGNIFSVNGPPGTGKTTLLKEIVVSNIIERAILLAEYQDPDQAFEKQPFLHGEKEEHAYSSFVRGWYRLKNDTINDYSILVTSCNNAAVENVSKELPLGTGLLKDLKPASDDTEEYGAMLREVSGLFDPAQSQSYETIGKKACRDIYFTEYAKGLLDNEGAWGLVAASLGKRANISAFYNQVLNPLYWDFYPGRDFKDGRIKKYEQARDEFQKQLKVVKGLQDQLKDICALVRNRADLVMAQNELEIRLPEVRAESSARVREEALHIGELEEALAQRVVDVQRVSEKRDNLEKRISETVQESSAQSARKRELLEKEVAARRAAGVLGRFINRKNAEANKMLAAEYHQDVIKAGDESRRLAQLLDELKAEMQRAQAGVDLAVQSKDQAAAELAEKKSGIIDLEHQVREFERGLEQIKAELDEGKSACLEKVGAFTQASSVDAGAVLDPVLIDGLLSRDTRESTDAQVANPWFTRRYNIEREKLFYYAMKLSKEFVLSSRSCRDNFKILGHYWGMLPGDDKERIIFHSEDRERFAGALYQTLFLLVPVLSSTFASLGTFLRDAKQAGVIGTLIVDEAGQAQPQMAAGALYRSRKAMIVGDPKQVQPVVTDDLKLLKRAFDDDELLPYKSKTASVQSFADRLNCFGTYLDNGTDYPEWVGCPLLVHRRCISPMYDISNELSYNGIMKQQTREPDAQKAASFVYDKSQWINVTGKEKGNKNHFVEEQAQKVCEILEMAFSKSDQPSLYIISPFTSVVNGMKTCIKEYKKKSPGTNLSRCDAEWMGKNIGTVHTFQGKEADEVIFLLGCDRSREARGAVLWVNANIVNVAVTRAKFRLYVIGDEEVWQNSSCIEKAKTILDTFAIKKIKAILEEQLPKDEEAKALAAASASLPSITSFMRDETEVSIDTGSLLRGLDQSFMTTSLSREQLGKFGFQSMEDVREMPPEIQDNLLLGMKLFYLLSPVYKVNNKLDASCCAILFCKAMELQMKDCFEESLKAIFPDVKIKGQGKGRAQVVLRDARSKELTLGAFQVLLKTKGSELGRRMELKGKKEYGSQWWAAFEARLSDCAARRNKCCHSGLFGWKDQSYLLADMFMRGRGNAGVQMEGILFESKVGKML